MSASKKTPRVNAVKGTRDILPPDSVVWQAMEQKAMRVFSRFGYREIRTPVMEPTELFVRSIGESTDIVNKEMYEFKDKKGRSLCLRPEGTASVARAYVEHNLRLQPHPLRLYYLGPMFRYERPQKGRYRQFYQIGAEILGTESPSADLEMLVMVHRFLKELGFRELSILLNSVGCDQCRPEYRAELTEKLRAKKDQLCQDCIQRLDQNPLRVFDCKVPSCRETVTSLPLIGDHLCEGCREHHDRVVEGLQRAGISAGRDDGLVRGLDYYTRTVFEVVSADLGAQNAILGGGRYDRLIQDLGGPETPAIGFAIGEDRLMEILPDSFREASLREPVCYVLPLAPEYLPEAETLALQIREQDVVAVLEVDGRPVRAAMKYADRMTFDRVVFLGEDEVAGGTVTVKEMRTGEQSAMERDVFLNSLT